MKKIVALALILLPMQSLGIQTERAFIFIQKQKEVYAGRISMPTSGELYHGLADIMRNLAALTQPSLLKAIVKDQIDKLTK